MAVELTSKNFNEIIKQAPAAFVDLWAEWCGPCRMMIPIVEKLSEEYNGKVLMAKVNVDDEPDVPAQYEVRNIPTMLFFKNGELVDKHIGTIPESALRAKLDALL